MFQFLKNKIISVKKSTVLANARNHGLDVNSVSDFRKFGYHYDRIEELVDEYSRSFVRYNTMGGLTAGIGDFSTSIAVGGLDSVFLAIQLYRLAQRFAILNGFDGSNSLHKDKIMRIYVESLSMNAAIKTALKYHLSEAGSLAENGKASEAMLLKIIIKAGKNMGKDITSKKAGRLIPIIGGVEGAVINYSLAQVACKSMKKEYKHLYFKTWQGEEI